MPISLNRVGAPAFDVAALQAAIDARSLQAAQNAAEIEAKGYSAISSGVGDAAKLYQQGRLKRDEMDLQSRREDEARRERRALHEEDAARSSTQHLLDSVGKLRDDKEKLRQSGYRDKDEAPYNDYLKRVQLFASGKEKLDSRQRAQVAAELAAEGNQYVIPELMTQIEVPEAPDGYRYIRKPDGGYQVVTDESKRRTDESINKARNEVQHWFDRANNKTLSRAARAEAAKELQSARDNLSRLQPAPTSQPVDQQPFGAGFDPRTPQSYDEMLAAEMRQDAAPLASTAGSPLELPPEEPELPGPQIRIVKGVRYRHDGEYNTEGNPIWHREGPEKQVDQTEVITKRRAGLTKSLTDQRTKLSAAYKALSDQETLGGNADMLQKQKNLIASMESDLKRTEAEYAALDSSTKQPLRPQQIQRGTTGPVYDLNDFVSDGSAPVAPQSGSPADVPVDQTDTTSKTPVVTPDQLEEWNRVSKKTNDPRVSGMIDLAVSSKSPDVAQAVDVVMKSLATDKPPKPGSREYYLLAHAVRLLETSGVDVQPKPSTPPAETFWDRVGATPQPF